MSNERINAKDRIIIRDLAKRLAELSARPIEDEKRELWYKHNALESVRPLIFCSPENGWNEIIRDSDLVCEGQEAKWWEKHFKMELFHAEQMGDDRVVPQYFYTGYNHVDTGWGMQETITRGENQGSYVWDAPLKSYDDLDKLHLPDLIVDYDATRKEEEFVKDFIGDIIPVKNRMFWAWSYGMTWQFIKLRGLEQMMIDMFDNPEGVHSLMALLRDGHAKKLDFLEENGLLALNNDDSYVGSGGFGWSHELPKPDFDGKVRVCDTWGFSESQETIGVSPDMFDEFIFQYQLPLIERFGLACYGCCEPVDKRWHVIKRIPNLRRVSVSAWADIEVMAEQLGSNYIYSWKPNPADLAHPTFDEPRIRAYVRDMLEKTKGCIVEIIMKDCHTIGNDASRVVRWTKIVREEIERLY